MQLLITRFLSIGTTDIHHYSYGIIRLCNNCPFWLLVYLQGAFIEDDDKADDEENPHMEDILDALSELFCLGFITDYLASAALVDRYPNVVCNLFGLGSDSVQFQIISKYCKVHYGYLHFDHRKMTVAHTRLV